MQFAPPKPYTAKLEDKIVHNDKFTQYMFELAQPHEMPFVAGQYVSVKVSDKGERRSYSICSSPDIIHGFELLVEHLPDGLGSTYLQKLEFGQEIQALGPMGRFVVDDTATEAEPALMFIATGSGIAPIHSMILDLLQTRHDQRPMVLYWGLRHEAELVWSTEFQELSQTHSNFSFHPVISRPIGDWPLCRGRVTDCLNTHGLTQPAGYYVCGSPAMVTDTIALLQKNGVPAISIHHEKF